MPEVKRKQTNKTSNVRSWMKKMAKSVATEAGNEVRIWELEKWRDRYITPDQIRLGLVEE